MKQRFSKRTRLVSALLTLAMVFTFLPFSALAATEDKGTTEDKGIEIKDTNNFPDKRFVDNIRQYDTKTDGYLSKQELDKVTEMNLGPNAYGYGKNIESLKGIEYFTKLEILECPYNKITELDMSSNLALKSLGCYRNQLTQLNVSGNSELTSLSCGDNQLTALVVSSNPNLTLLDCHNNQLTSLNLSNNDKLMSLNCDNNQLTFLDLSNNVRLSDNAKLYKNMFKCSGNKYPITIDATKRTFDLNDLPTGFDVSKASGWVGGTVDGSTLKVNPGADRVTYIYDCGNGLSAEFALTVNDGTGSVTPPSGGGSTGGGSTPGGSTGGSTGGGDGGTVTPPEPPVTPPSGGGSTGGSSGGSDGGAGIAVLAIGGAAVAGLVGYGVYNHVAAQKLRALLPPDVSLPENRAKTALLLWDTAGRPEPAEAPVFADVADPDTAKAAQWCVEQGLMKRRLNGRFGPDGTVPAYRILNAYRQLTGQ